MWTVFLFAGLTCLTVGLVAQYSQSISLGGISIQKAINRTGDHANSYEITLPKAYAISSWVKTDGDTAAGNLPSGHGQTSSLR